ncbi:MAG: hypothetical protein ACI9R3_004021 [Verrucomicrobiales bacterium]|jgi:hypothetical protein
MLAVPIMPLTAGQKGALALALFIAAEIAFWGGAILVGKEVIYRYLGRLIPKRWRHSSTTEAEESPAEQNDNPDSEPTLNPDHKHHRTVRDHEGEEDSDG